MASQIAPISTAANPTRDAASQKGGIPPLSATSVTMNVPPQTKPRRAIMSQLSGVIWGEVSIMPDRAKEQGAARGPLAEDEFRTYLI